MTLCMTTKHILSPKTLYTNYQACWWMGNDLGLFCCHIIWEIVIQCESSELRIFLRHMWLFIQQLDHNCSMQQDSDFKHTSKSTWVAKDKNEDVEMAKWMSCPQPHWVLYNTREVETQTSTNIHTIFLYTDTVKKLFSINTFKISSCQMLKGKVSLSID